jgi:hypothetical protein
MEAKSAHWFYSPSVSLPRKITAIPQQMAAKLSRSKQSSAIVMEFGKLVQQILKYLDIVQQSLYEATQHFIGARASDTGRKWQTATEHIPKRFVAWSPLGGRRSNRALPKRSRA